MTTASPIHHELEATVNDTCEGAVRTSGNAPRARRAGALIAGLSLVAAAGCASSPQGPPPTATTTATATAALPTASATASATSTAQVADAKGSACPALLPLGFASFAPDGHTLLTACGGSGVCAGSDKQLFVDVWSVPDGALVRSLPTGMENIHSAKWGPNGWLAVAADPTSGLGHISLFSTKTWALKAETDHYCIQGAAFDPAGASFVVSGCDGQIKAIATDTGKIVGRPSKEAHVGGDYTIDVAFSQDGKTLLVEDDGVGFQTLDPATLQRRSKPAKEDQSSCSAFSPAHDAFAFGRQDGSLSVLETKSPTKVRTLSKPSGAMCVEAAWVDATHLAVALSDGAVALWDTAGKGSKRDLSPAGGSVIETFRMSPTGGTLAGVNKAGAVLVWDVTSGEQRTIFQQRPAAKGEDAPSTEIGWSPRGAQLAAATGDRLVVWDVKSAKEVAATRAGTPLLRDTVVWSPDGAVVAILDKTARLLRIADGAALTLAVVDRGGRVGVSGSDSGLFSGPQELAGCVVPDSVPAAKRTLRASLAADFFAGRPVAAGP